jgi:hypothetical protein
MWPTSRARCANQAATWAGGVHSAQRRNPPGLSSGPAAESRWISSDGSPAKSREQKRGCGRRTKNPNSFSPFSSLSCLASPLSPHRKPRESELPAAAGEEDGAAPRALAGARALRWWSAPPSRVFERGARARLSHWMADYGGPRGGVESPRPVSVLVPDVSDLAAVRGGPRQKVSAWIPPGPSSLLLGLGFRVLALARVRV